MIYTVPGRATYLSFVFYCQLKPLRYRLRNNKKNVRPVKMNVSNKEYNDNCHSGKEHKQITEDHLEIHKNILI